MKSFNLKKFSIIFRVVINLMLLVGFFPLQHVFADSAGWALQFDGIDDYVSLGKTELILGSNWEDTKSFSMWIKPLGNADICEPVDVEDVAFCDQILVNQPHFFGIARGIISGQDRIWVWNYSATGTEKIGIQYAAGEWIHVSFVHANNMLKAYRNGNLIGQIASGTTFTGTGDISSNFQLGAFFRPDLPVIQPFEGLVDEVRIYNTELTQQTIVDTLRTTLVGDEAGLAAYYQMSNGSGLVLTDDSIHSFDGTLLDGINPGSDVLYPQWVLSDAWDGPIANDQSVSVDEDSSLAITLTGSPAISGGTLTFFLVDLPLHGDLSGSNANYTYTPDDDFNGIDSFTFYVTEGAFQSSVATVSIDVASINDSPVAVNDTYSVNVNSILNVDELDGVLINDQDIENNILTAQLISDVQHGVLTLNLDGSFTYTPTASYAGTDYFTYRADDGEDLSNVATVEITVVQTTFALYLPIIIK